MNSYLIFTNPENETCLISDKFNLNAFFLNVLWLLYHKMFSIFFICGSMQILIHYFLEIPNLIIYSVFCVFLGFFSTDLLILKAQLNSYNFIGISRGLDEEMARQRLFTS